MKKLNSLIAVMLFLFLAVGAIAQSKTGAGYFVGKRNVLISGTPCGDLKRIYALVKKDRSLTGIVQDSTNKKRR